MRGRNKRKEGRRDWRRMEIERRARRMEREEREKGRKKVSKRGSDVRGG